MSSGEQLILSLLQEVRDEQKRIADGFDAYEARAQSFEDQLRQHASASEDRHMQILSAFPAKDIDGHRRYHETVIEWRELRNKIVRECLINAAKAGSLIGVGWLLYAIWTAVKLELTQGS